MAQNLGRSQQCRRSTFLPIGAHFLGFGERNCQERRKSFRSWGHLLLDSFPLPPLGQGLAISLHPATTRSARQETGRFEKQIRVTYFIFFSKLFQLVIAGKIRFVGRKYFSRGSVLVFPPLFISRLLVDKYRDTFFVS